MSINTQKILLAGVIIVVILLIFRKSANAKTIAPTGNTTPQGTATGGKLIEISEAEFNKTK